MKDPVYTYELDLGYEMNLTCFEFQSSIHYSHTYYAVLYTYGHTTFYTKREFVKNLDKKI